MIRPEIIELFKYRADLASTQRIVEGTNIWFSRPVGFNDPFDCDISFTEDLAPDEYIAARVRQGTAAGVSREKMKAIIDSEVNPDGSLKDEVLQRFRDTAAEFRKANEEAESYASQKTLSRC